jgi:hypothetical protein
LPGLGGNGGNGGNGGFGEIIGGTGGNGGVGGGPNGNGGSGGNGGNGGSSAAPEVMVVSPADQAVRMATAAAGETVALSVGLAVYLAVPLVPEVTGGTAALWGALACVAAQAAKAA